MKVLNLYAGIGGNRKLWQNVEATAIEYDPKIAAIYQDFFPQDKVIVADAHSYLEEHYNEFDFIWSSPPCPTHSKIRMVMSVAHKKETSNLIPHEAKFPDMKLYEEILFLKGYFKGKWVVENVISWYDPLITPYEINKHYFWSNYFIRPLRVETRGHDAGIPGLERIKGFDLSKYKDIDKRKALRNCVEPETGLWVFNEAFKQQPTLV